MDFITKWVSGLIETAVRNVVAGDQFKAMVNEAVKANTSAANLDYDELANALIQNGLDYHQIAQNVDMSDLIDEFDSSDIEARIIEKIDTDDIKQGVIDEIDTDDIKQEIVNEIDTDSIADQVKEDFDYSQVEIDYSEIEIDYEALGRALVNLAAARG